VVRQYLLSVVAASLLLSLVMAILPKGKLQKIAGLIGSLFLILTVLAPVMRIDSEDLAKAVSRLQIQTEELRTGIAVTNREIQARLIKESCESYIWDKATEMGVALDVEIRLSDLDGYPHPVGVVLKGTLSAADRLALSRFIADNLGIEEDRQEWMEE